MSIITCERCDGEGYVILDGGMLGICPLCGGERAICAEMHSANDDWSDDESAEILDDFDPDDSEPWPID